MNRCPVCGSETPKPLTAIADFNDLAKQLEQEKLKNEFLQKSADEQLRLLLAKYWLTHTNDDVHATFGCNYVPSRELQDAARPLVDINVELSGEQLAQINRDVIKSCMRGHLNFAI